MDDKYYTIFVVFVCIGMIPALIADSKGRNFISWWIFGTLAFIIALPAALLLQPNEKALERRRLQRLEQAGHGEQAREAMMSASDFSREHTREEDELREKHAAERRELQLSQEVPRKQVIHRIEQLEQEIAALTTNISRQVRQNELVTARHKLDMLLVEESSLLYSQKSQMEKLKAQQAAKMREWETGQEVEQMVVELLTEVAKIKGLKKTYRYDDQVLFGRKSKGKIYPVEGRDVVVVRDSLTSWFVKGETRNRCVLIFSVEMFSNSLRVNAFSDSSEEENRRRREFSTLYKDIVEPQQMKKWYSTTKDLSRDELEKALIEVVQKVEDIGPCSYESACACIRDCGGPHPFGVCGMTALYDATIPYLPESIPTGIGMPSSYLRTVSSGDKIMVFHSLLGNLRYAEPDILRFLALVSPHTSMTDLTPHFPDIDLQAQVNALLQLRFLVFGSEDQILRSRIQHGRGAYHQGEQIQTLRLNTATDCNLACTYCHGTSDDGKVRRMSLETATRAIRLYTDLLLEHNHPLMQIRYFGGEPLLNWPVLCDSLRFAAGMARQHDLRLGVIINTNATLLTPTMIDELKLYRSNLNVVVSLDGPSQAHDVARKHHNGKGSFHQVCKGLDLLQAAEIPVSISTTLGAHNQKHLRELVDLLQARGIHWMGVNPIGIVPDESTPASLATDLIDAIDYAGVRNFHVSGLWQGVCDRLRGGTTGSYCGGNGGELSVLPDGEVFPCQAQPIRLGTLDDVETRALFNSMAYGKVVMRVAGNLPECYGCEIEGMCAGGCAADAHACSGSIYGRTQYCEFMKTMVRGYLERLGQLAQGEDVLPHYYG